MGVNSFILSKKNELGKKGWVWDLNWLVGKRCG